EGQMAVVRTEFGEAEFKCQAGKIPLGMIFVPYGPPTCKLMGGDTDGTGMPTSKEFNNEQLIGVDALQFSIDGDVSDVAAWTEIEAGRFMPRRVRGSFQGRA